MDTTNERQGQSSRRPSARYQPVTEEEMLNEGEYEDEVWPARPPSSSRRYQPDVRNESGRAADTQSQPVARRVSYPANERHTIPARRTAAHGNTPALQISTPSRVSIDEEDARITTVGRYNRNLPGIFRRFHWLVFVGLAMLVMILGWVALSAVGNWWQTTQDDWHYGRPRTYQVDAIVGHHDSQQNPSHFIAMNLNRHILIIEMPGGDASKSVIFSGPTLVGPGQDLTPVTLTFQDVNHDGKLDMLVNIQGSQLIFLNANGTFVSATQNQSGG